MEVVEIRPQSAAAVRNQQLAEEALVSEHQLRPGDRLQGWHEEGSMSLQDVLSSPPLGLLLFNVWRPFPPDSVAALVARFGVPPDPSLPAAAQS
eukprot:8595232-Alexandrium_andersonii.AAC.1